MTYIASRGISRQASVCGTGEDDGVQGVICPEGTTERGDQKVRVTVLSYQSFVPTEARSCAPLSMCHCTPIHARRYDDLSRWRTACCALAVTGLAKQTGKNNVCAWTCRSRRRRRYEKLLPCATFARRSNRSGWLPSKKTYKTLVTRRAYTRIILGHAAHHLTDRRFIRSVCSAHVLGAGLRKYGHFVSNRLRHAFACMIRKRWPYPSWRSASAGIGLLRHSKAAICSRPKPGSALNTINSPYTVSVYPIEQEPGVWFATYLINEYRDGAERILANVSLRHNVHGSEALATHAARVAGRADIARLAPHHKKN